MKKKNNIPAIRIKGFQDEWQERAIGEFYDFKNGVNKGKEFFGFGVPIVNFTDVFHNRRIGSRDLKGKVDLLPNEIANYKVNQGDIFFTRTSETIDEIGQPSVMMDSCENTVFSGFVLRARAINDDPLDLLFKQYAFYTSSFRTEMVKKSSMTTRALTSGTAIKKMLFSFPSNKTEQTQIGNFFQNLDQLINLHQKKYDKLVILKKAMLEKMFPKPGAKVPEIRFNGFEGNWEEKDFENNIVSIQTGTSLLGNSNNSGMPLIKMGNIQRGYFTFEKIEFLEMEINVEKENIVHFGDFFFNTRNTLELVGKGATWVGESGKFAFNNNIARVEFKNVDTLFFNYLYNTQGLIKQVQSRAMGTTSVAAIYPRSLYSIKYHLPSLEEQKCIGAVLLKLDKLITNNSKQLEKLKNIKKACLEKMFV